MSDKIDPLEANSTIEKRSRRRKHGGCTICPPHKGENRSRVPAHTKQKPKYKQHRRKSE